MKLHQLTKGISLTLLNGDQEVTINQIVTDSRKVVPQSLFVAIKGTTVDGHRFIEQAIHDGAVAILMAHPPEKRQPGVTYLLVDDTAHTLGLLLDRWHGHPSSKLCLVGVTGTNGKTTIATLLYALFKTFGHRVGLISTVCNYIGEEALPTEQTTPDPLVLHDLLARMAAAGCEYVFMEVSSHAIDQQRISGLTFRGGIFTNLSRDHLDYHKSVDHYLKTKKRFFDELPATAFALTNVDDKAGAVMLQNTKATKSSYSMQQMADFKGRILESHIEGTELEINDKALYVSFVGRFNAYNLLAVYGTALILGKQPDEVLLVLSSLHPVAGRFETLISPLGYTAIVDYAHTPDALANVLNGIHDVLNGNGTIITVVGAGGNRDRGKRPLMAQEAAKQSDRVILTSDNPRDESPEAIIEEMMAGLTLQDRKKTLCITDRKEAIKTATMLANKGDVILIAGKGHEDYQEIKGVKHHLDDREIVRTIFATQN